MDYSDTFDSTNKKCHRVRSWYLYEQYKSLESNQHDAARLLKSKSYQNNILRQELQERRARRKLCDQYGLCHSESTLDRSIRSYPSASEDDLFESLCELHEGYEVDEMKESCSYDGSQTSKNNDDNSQVEENKIDNFSDTESLQSVIVKDKLEGNLAHNVKQELEMVKKNIAKNITLQLETVKENIECLETFTKHNNEDDFLENNNDLDDKKVKNKTTNIVESLFSIWSKLVVFAYDSIKFNHGNCYYQCSSQLLTAVLACDFIRRGVDGMCNILQSYVSPIKYATSDSSNDSLSATRVCECSRKKIDNYEKPYKIAGSSKHRSNIPRYKSTFNRRCCSENKYETYSSDNRIKEQIWQGASEPWRSTNIFNQEKKSSGKYSSNIYKKNKNLCKCHYLKDIVNPILRVATYIENILQDLEETEF